jgi:hypothetical protein
VSGGCGGTEEGIAKIAMIAKIAEIGKAKPKKRSGHRAIAVIMGYAAQERQNR